MKCKFLSFFILFNLFNIILMLNIFLFVYNWFESPFHFRLKFGAPISTALKNGYLPIPLMVGQPFFQLNKGHCNVSSYLSQDRNRFYSKRGGGVMRQEKGFLYLCEEWSLFPKEGCKRGNGGGGVLVLPCRSLWFYYDIWYHNMIVKYAVNITKLYLGKFRTEGNVWKSKNKFRQK